MLKRLRENQEFKQALAHIVATPQGKVFLKRFLRDCHVTNPKFSADPSVTQFNEGARHLAMSYLRLLAKDDPQDIINQIEKETKQNV